MDIESLSLLASLLALVVSVVTLVRTRAALDLTKAQGEYAMMARLTLGNMELYIAHDVNEQLFDFSGELTAHSSTPVKLVGVFLEYGSDDDYGKRQRNQIKDPMYIPQNEKREIKAAGYVEMTQRVAKDFNISQVHYWITIVVQGIYGQEITTRYFLLYHDIPNGYVSTRCPNDYAI